MGRHLLKALATVLFAIVLANTSYGQADEVMLVEYVDWQPGSGVAVKLYNPTNASINLSGYTLAFYNNGNTSATGTYNLSGTIAAKGTLITGNGDYCNTQCTSGCDITNSNVGVNGNDVVVLRNGTTVLDMIGLLGYDPGSSGWKVGGVSNALKWHTVTRKSDNCTRYTSTSGSGANSWPNSSGTNVTGWTTSSINCLSQGFVLNTSSTTPEILVPSKDTTVCSGTSISFNSNAKIKWLRRRNGNESTLSSNDSILSISFNTAGSDTIIVQTESCGVTTEDTLVVTVGSPFTFSLGNDTTICGTINLNLDAQVTGATYTWQDNSALQTYNAVDTGLYWVAAEKNSCSYADSIRVDSKTANTFNFGIDTTLCQGDSLILSHNCTGCTYLWSDNSSNDSLIIKSNGTYWLQADDGVCKAADTIMVSFTPKPQVNLGVDTVLCSGDSIILNSPATTTRIWEDNSIDSSRTIKTSGLYWLQVGAGTCSVRDTINITFNTPLQLNLGADTALCSGDSLILNSPANVSRLWEDNTTDSSRAIKTTGTYWLQITDGVCDASDTISININTLPLISLGKDTTVCSGDSIILNSPASVSRLWENSATDSSRTIKVSGVYWLQITDANNCKNSDTVVITAATLPSFSIGPDTNLCANGNVILKVPNAYSGLVQWSTGAVTDSISVSSPDMYWAQVAQNGCSYRDSINVNPSPVFNKTLKDTTLCSGQTVFLDATTTGATYLWDDGSTLATNTASTSGTYKVLITKNGCSFIDSSVVTIIALPQKPNLADTTVCEDASVNLNATTNATSYLWNTGATTPFLTLDSGGMYVVVASNQCGGVSDTAIITVDLCSPPYIPNVFTPNGDSINDYFYIDFNNAYNFEVSIFNRWGEQVFQSTNPKFAWDGRFKGELVPAGVYIYIVTSKIGIGKTFNAKGSLTIYR